MKVSIRGTNAARWRSGTFLAALLIGPLFAGCVSAVDDTTAFGFNKTGVTGGVAANAAENASPAPQTAAATAAEDADGAAKAATAKALPADTQNKAVVAAVEKEATTADTPREAPLATGTAAIAAFAGSSVLASSQTEQDGDAGGRHANQTMFASLYAQSQAKTPIRNTDVGKTRRVVLPREGAPVEIGGAGGAALPGVRNASSLFEIGQKASADYDADIIDEANGEEGTFQTASLSGLARLAPNGLTVQRPDVQTSCFQPDLVAIIRSIETRFHTKALVTSGYRSPTHNLRVRGAKRSMHLQCKAADIIVPGADKFQVANFVRTLPGRGGVGTYCNTSAIHVDTGPQRDWNWACRRGPRTLPGLILASQRTAQPKADD